MEPEKHQELVGILREVVEIVDEGLGVLGSTVAKDHMLIQLAGFMVADRFDQWGKLPLRPPEPTPEEREAEERGLALWEAHDRALGLTEAVVRQAAGKLAPVEVWAAYEFFLRKSRALGRRGRKGLPPPA